MNLLLPAGDHNHTTPLAGPPAGPAVHMKPTEFNGVFGRRTHGPSGPPASSCRCSTNPAMRHKRSASLTACPRNPVSSSFHGFISEERVTSGNIVSRLTQGIAQRRRANASIDYGKRQIWSCSERGGRASGPVGDNAGAGTTTVPYPPQNPMEELSSVRFQLRAVRVCVTG